MNIGIVSIGSSSSGNSYIVTNGNTYIILDAGISGRRTKAALQEYSITPEAVSAICVTHEHVDHIGNLHVIAGVCAEAEILMTEGTYNGWVAGKKQRVDESRIGIVDTEHEFDIGDITVRTFSLSHDAREPIGYTFLSGGMQLSVVTDTGIITQEIHDEISSADLLVMEANHEVEILQVGNYPYVTKRRILSELGHLSNVAAGYALSDVIEYRKSNGVQNPLRIMLAHISANNNTPHNALLTVKSIFAEKGFRENIDYTLAFAPEKEQSGFIEV